MLELVTSKRLDLDDALNTVDQIMQYGYQKSGLGAEPASSLSYSYCSSRTRWRPA